MISVRSLGQTVRRIFFTENFLRRTSYDTIAVTKFNNQNTILGHSTTDVTNIFIGYNIQHDILSIYTISILLTSG